MVGVELVARHFTDLEFLLLSPNNLDFFLMIESYGRNVTERKTTFTNLNIILPFFAIVFLPLDKFHIYAHSTDSP